MTGFASYDDLISEITVNGKVDKWDFYKVGVTAQAAGQWASLWYQSGNPGAGSDPAGTPGTQYSQNAGSIYFPAAGGSDTRHLIRFGGVPGSNATLMIYDRLVGVSGITLSSTGNKTVNSAALTRYTSGVGVQMWLEVTTATTGTAPQISANSYTNQDGTTGRAGATLTFPAAATVVRWMGQLPLQAGDRGVQAISTLNVSVAGTAGVANVLLIKPLAYIPLLANVWNEIDLVLQLTSLERVYDNATLGLALFVSATGANTIYGSVVTAYG